MICKILVFDISNCGLQLTSYSLVFLCFCASRPWWATSSGAHHSACYAPFSTGPSPGSVASVRLRKSFLLINFHNAISNFRQTFKEWYLKPAAHGSPSLSLFHGRQLEGRRIGIWHCVMLIDFWGL